MNSPPLDEQTPEANTPSAIPSIVQEAKATSQDANATGGRRIPIKGLIVRSGFLAFCSFAGLAGSVALGMSLNHSEPEPEELPKSSTSEHAEPEPEPEPETAGHRINTLIKSGNFAKALKLCRSGSREIYGSDERLLDYREALCLEALSRWQEAREAFENASRLEPVDSPVMWARANLGKARCALAEGKVAEGRELLGQVLLRSGHSTCRGQRILEECIFLLGCAAVKSLGVPANLDPFDTSAIAWPSLEGKLDQYLDWLPVPSPTPVNREPHGKHDVEHAGHAPPHKESEHSEHAPAKKESELGEHAPAKKEAEHAPPKKEAEHAEHAPAKMEAEHSGHVPAKKESEDKGHSQDDRAPKAKSNESSWITRLNDKFYVTIDVPSRPVFEQLLAIAVANRIGLKIEPRAQAALKTSSKALQLDRAPLSIVLDVLTQQCGCTWKMADGTVFVSITHEVNEQAQREAALESLRSALSMAPKHPWTRAARLTAANLEFLCGRIRRASVDFRQFLDQYPHSVESVVASYNLGLIELTTGNWPVAKARFLDTLDRAPGTTWADYGWWWIARGHMDQGDFDAARIPLNLSFMGRTKPVKSAAGLGLAACALLEDREDDAKGLLENHRVLNQDNHAAFARFFESLFRYRSNPTEQRGKRVAESLYGIGEGRILGPAGFLLAGKIYQEIGRYDRAAGVYDAASSLITGPLAIQMKFAAAERYDQLDLRDDARKRYTLVAALNHEELGIKSRLRLADLAARDRRGAECIQICRQLIGRDEVDRNEVLKLMGRGYELLKQYRLAAACFGGHVPEE